MSFFRQDKRIYIDQSITEDDIEKIRELTQAPSSDYEISLMNIKTVSKVAIQLFSRLKDAKFIVNEKLLYEYLQNLCFNVSLNDPYTISTKELDYCVLAGSAGSIEKTLAIIKELPASSMTFFVVLHQMDKESTKLVELIQRVNHNYTVKHPQTHEKILPGFIYVAPPGQQIRISQDQILLSKDEKVNYARPSIAVFFESLAKNTVCAHTAVIVLCGYGHDGIESLNDLIKNKATVLIQDPAECEAKDLLTNSIETRAYTSIISSKEIKNFLFHHLIDEEIQKHTDGFLRTVFEQYGYDFSGYKRPHIYRRIKLFYQRIGARSFRDFSDLIINKKDFFDEFFYHLSINVSAFFRNPEVYKVLREMILKKHGSASDIKIWSAGCSAGEEPYSLAMLMEEIGLLDKTLIYATDHNSIKLAQAKNAIYSNEYMDSHLLENYTQSGGKKNIRHYYEVENNLAIITEQIKRKVLFFNHSLIHDSKFNNFDMIICRNVLIYFDSVLKRRVLKLFYDSLLPLGILVLGESEYINDSSYFKLIDKKNNIYQKVM